FSLRLLGLPRAEMLHAYNPSRDREVVVNSVFTATRQFHVSPAHSRVIPAMGKISFRVLFLPTEGGSIESSLFINTSSHGVLSYQVFGTGTLTSSPEDPRLQLANAYLLLPHIQNIQTSHTLAETTNASLLRVHLECSLPNDAYQQIKSCCFMSDDPMLLEMSLTVRMEKAQQDIVEHRQYLLDNLFIAYVAMEKTKTSGDSSVDVYVMHSGNSLVHIQEIRQLSQKDTSPVEFDPVLLSSSSTNFTKVASISCKAGSCDSGSSYADKKDLLEGATTLKACLSCPVMEGYFDVDPSAALFHIEPHHNTSGFWSIWFTNNFDFSIELNEVFIARETRNILKILNFAKPLTLPPGCWNVFSLKLSVKDTVTNVLSSICLATNVGVMFEIPLQIYSTVSKQGDLHFEAIAHCDIQCYLGKSDSANLLWQKSLSLDRSAWDVDSELASKLYEKWQKIRHGEACSRRSILGSARFIHQKKPEEESFAFFLPRLTTEPGVTLNFSATAVRSSMVKYFVLRNPSSFPVTLQLLPLSYYPDPQASLSLLNKWFGINVQSINFTTTEFRLMDECSQRDLTNEKCSSELLWLSLQPLETRKVGVVFTPVDYKRVASLILIRNNLTVLDVVNVEGFGAKELLKVGGRLPGAGGSLRFKVPEATLMDCRRQLKDSKQILSITKNFKVENIGPLPITISSMKINGYSCQGYGFEVLDCQEFFLAQNSSREISIVFTPDFTSSWVIRELTLVSAADLEFHFTLNVTLPHHLLPLCADVVPGPSWEESFWRLTVLFVSLSLLGVILIAFQQAQYILAEFMKSRQRPNPSSSPQQNSNSVDVIGSDSYKGSCKTFMDSYSSSDKGKGKGFLSVGTSSSRSQNAAKRSPATYSHSQKKHKCSVYYSKQKPNTAAGSAIATTDEKQSQIVENQISAPKEDICTDVSENWVTLKYANGINVNKNLTLPENFLGKEESALKNTVLIKSTSSECDLKEDLQACMFPKETNLKTSENLVELKEQEFCPVKMSKKLPESHLSRSSPQQQPELQEILKKNRNSQQVPLRNETENCETLKKQINLKPSTEKKINKGPKEEAPFCAKEEMTSEQEDAYRKKKPQEKKEGNVANMNWNRNRTSRKNKKKNINISARVPEQSELKHMCSEFERPDLRANIGIRAWCPQGNGENCKADQKTGSLSIQGETESFYQRSKKKCMEKFCSDSSSDCGSSSGSVRASRGSWGSWSSTSSSDGDKKPMITARHFLPSRETVSQNDFPSETPITLNLSHNICNTSRDMNSIPQYPETLCPNFTDIAADPDKNKALYPTGDLWPAQPVCLTNSLNYNLENNIPCMIQESPSVHNRFFFFSWDSFIDWNAACDSQFSNMYCPLEMNEYGAFPEENMNYPSGFPGTAAVQNTAFIDQNCPSTWNAPPNMPPAWEPTSYINSTPYLSSTRSLSPMSGLFGSIWAPQSDVYESCCPVSATTQHSTHVENQAVMCKQEYYPRFNPFRAYMNLDIWTTAANRNANFPLSRDSGYCGNV
ncbi:T131L protein, partial [Centropus unirufus]|nr:T131L protein [Centropus unirufus]